MKPRLHADRRRSLILTMRKKRSKHLKFKDNPDTQTCIQCIQYIHVHVTHLKPFSVRCCGGTLCNFSVNIFLTVSGSMSGSSDTSYNVHVHVYVPCTCTCMYIVHLYVIQYINFCMRVQVMCTVYMHMYTCTCTSSILHAQVLCMCYAQHVHCTCIYILYTYTMYMYTCIYSTWMHDCRITLANHLKQVSLSELKAGFSTRLSHTYMYMYMYMYRYTTGTWKCVYSTLASEQKERRRNPNSMNIHHTTQEYRTQGAQP